MILNFLNDKFVVTSQIKHLTKGLLLWKTITPFLLITKIEDKKEYEKKMSAFNKSLKQFYEHGKFTFLTKNSPGDDETFYMHCLCFYLPQKAKETIKEFNVGLGVFTKQVFERRNKESKNTLKRFSNCKKNICISNVKQLFDVFEYKQNAI